MLEGDYEIVSKERSKYKESLNKTYETAKKEKSGMWDESNN